MTDGYSSKWSKQLVAPKRWDFYNYFMPTPILMTKLYIPPPRPKTVFRPYLIERLNQGLHRKLTLISAPAGFGKTTLVSEWVANCERPVAWLSLDEGDNDFPRFLTYFAAALQTIAPDIARSVPGLLQTPQPPSPETILTMLVNEIATIPHDFILILDDYHMIDSRPVDQAMNFLLEHLPPQMHLVITTREDPPFPLARLRVRNQLTELRVADLRFTASEAGSFLNQVMGLNLSAQAVDALEARTEGWIAGLQLAAISLQGNQNVTAFIESFTGSHHFVLDYLLEEVLHRQPENIQTFLMYTAILDRLCAPLCDAVLLSDSSHEILTYMERANLFIIPLDNERRWYRYHHLFVELLRQRLKQSDAAINQLHLRASVWYEENGLDIEAFQHAAAAHDIERCERLIEGKGMPLHFRGAVVPILNWLNSLPKATLDTTPSLWTTYASVLLVTGQANRVEPALQSAEATLQHAELNEKNRDLIGRIAAIRSTLAAALQQVDAIIEYSHRALEYLHPNNLAFRTSTIWKLGFAYHLQGNRVPAKQAYTEVINTGKLTGNAIFTIVATIGLGRLHELDNHLVLAKETYQSALQLIGDTPLPVAGEAHLGLARIFYEWNELDHAEQFAQKSLKFASSPFSSSEVVLARLKFAQGDASGANAILAHATHAEIADLRVLFLLRQGNITAAENLAQSPVSQARVYLAQGDTQAALRLLDSVRQHTEEKGWHDERLRMMVLQAIALYQHGAKDDALQLLADVLALTAPHGFIRTFVDEGHPMARLLSEIYEIMPDYIGKLLAVFESPNKTTVSQPLIDPLSERELEVLRLIAEGLSNQEISERLFLALSTVKGHNQRIFGKLQVQRRTEAIARARELGLL